MSRTLSNMLELGHIAPDFKLINPVTNRYDDLNSLKSDQGTIIMFICNHCPFVIHIIDKLTEVAKFAQNKGLSVIAINSNDIVNYPDDSPEKMKLLAEEKGFSFPYLFDESQEVAKSFKAACTPDLYFFDSELKLIYRGQFDDSRPGNDIPVTGNDLKTAIDQYLSTNKVSIEQKASMGCNIKWK